MHLLCICQYRSLDKKLLGTYISASNGNILVQLNSFFHNMSYRVLGAGEKIENVVDADFILGIGHRLWGMRIPFHYR